MDNLGSLTHLPFHFFQLAPNSLGCPAPSPSSQALHPLCCPPRPGKAKQVCF